MDHVKFVENELDLNEHLNEMEWTINKFEVIWSV